MNVISIPVSPTTPAVPRTIPPPCNQGKVKNFHKCIMGGVVSAGKRRGIIMSVGSPNTALKP